MVTAYPPLGLQGLLRQHNHDFQVVEDLGFEPSGEGEHVLLWVEKNGANTEWVAKKIADYAGLPIRDVSFAGVKDRHAITQQWFSIWIKNKPEPDWYKLSNLVNKEFTVLKNTRHARKIKRGKLKGNYFKITLRDLHYQGDISELENRIQQRIDLIAVQGVPNYFGEQRFGLNGNNIEKAQAWFAGNYKPKKTEKSWLLSSARSFIFNQVLEKRLTERTWQTVLPDDIMMLAGTQSIFAVDDVAAIQKRVTEKDVHITGPLYGSQTPQATGDQLLSRVNLEEEVYQANTLLCAGLDKRQLSPDRRPLRVIPERINFSIDVKDKSLIIEFYLPAGCYATAVLKEFVEYLE